MSTATPPLPSHTSASMASFCVRHARSRLGASETAIRFLSSPGHFTVSLCHNPKTHSQHSTDDGTNSIFFSALLFRPFIQQKFKFCTHALAFLSFQRRCRRRASEWVRALGQSSSFIRSPSDRPPPLPACVGRALVLNYPMHDYAKMDVRMRATNGRSESKREARCGGEAKDRRQFNANERLHWNMILSTANNFIRSGGECR